LENSPAAPALFQPWLKRWRLTPDGEGFTTRFGSHLLPVLSGGAAAMLKIASSEEERNGARVMSWYGGQGAAKVLVIEHEAILLERAIGNRSLTAMARGDEDDEATTILCETIGRLQTASNAPPPPTLRPLPGWFAALGPGAKRHGGVLILSAATAETLLASPQDARVLHGDAHHGNVLDGGPRGWLAIDPKGLMGERGYDYANILCNPDIDTAAAPSRLAQQASIIAKTAGLERERLLRWTLAYAGLSASWTLDSGGDASPALLIAKIVAGELGLAIP
jgi:streptomycin 6-kinase